MKKLVFTFYIFLAAISVSAQIHVTPTGLGDGTSWSNPTNLQQAMILAAKTPSSAVWVQACIYNLPTTLEIPPTTRVYGGFAGTETLLGQRNWATNVTIIDAGNNFRAVHLGDNALLSGFTVRNGFARSGQQQNGGGIWMGENAEVANSWILNNRAFGFGGGIYAEGDGLIINSVIAHNSAGLCGMAIFGTTVTLQNNTITDNYKFEPDCAPLQDDPANAIIFFNSAHIFDLAPAIGGDGFIAYLWQQSIDNLTWEDAEGINTDASYTTPQLTRNMYYRRIATSCGISDTSAVALVSATEIFLLDISEESDWNYMIVANDGSSIFFDIDVNSGMPSRLYVVPPGNYWDEGSLILFRENGLPNKLIASEHILYFGNFRGNKFDATLIWPDRTVEFFYDIETEINWNVLLNLFTQPNLPDNASSIRRVATLSSGSNCGRCTGLCAVFKFIGYTIGAIGCVAGIVATLGKALLACVPFIAGILINEVIDIAAIGVANDILGGILFLAKCALGDVGGCLSGAAKIATDIGADLVKFFDDLKAQDPVLIDEVIAGLRGITADPISVGGVIWAGSNVDAFQTFAIRPDLYTRFYQWNSSMPWYATGCHGGSSLPSHLMRGGWTVNPCPTGWRLPTQQEFQALINSGSSWANDGARGNIVAGRFFGSNHRTCNMDNLAGCIFLPAAGHRSRPTDREPVNQGSSGCYWSSSYLTGGMHSVGLSLFFNNNSTQIQIAGFVGMTNKTNGHSIRCVTTTVIDVTGVTLNTTSATLFVDGIRQLNATVLPENATFKAVTWSSSNTAVATVNNNGLVTAVAPGNAIITATTQNGGKTATAIISVITCRGLSVGRTCWAPNNVDAFQTFAVRPDMHTSFFQWNRSTAWPASGTITGWETDITDPFWTINPCPEGWRLPTSAEFEALDNIGSSWAYAWARGNSVAGRFYGPNHASCRLPDNMDGCTFLPASGRRTHTGILENRDQFIVGEYWSREEASSSSGLVLRIWSGQEGSNPRGGSWKAGGFSVRCVQINPIPVANVMLNETVIPLRVGGRWWSLRAIVLPENATNRGVTWSSSNTNIATVDDDGLITAFSVGTATITATTIDGNKTATAIVTVTSIPPDLFTNVASNISFTSATLGGGIRHPGAPEYIERGVVFGTTQAPTLADSRIVVPGTGIGDFSVDVINLMSGTTYYVRTYAITATDTAFGGTIGTRFTTLSTSLPIITTTMPSNITSTSVTIGGNIIYIGTPDYTERGIVFATTPNPTIEENYKIIVDGTGIGTFNADISNLTINTTYYARAFATNLAGTAYGNQVSFTTFGPLPILTTSIPNNITSTSAILGGYITNTGLPAYTERGVVFSTSENPTIDDNRTEIPGSGTGSFSTLITGLSSNTRYYARAFAINDNGIVLGEPVSFVTLDSEMIVTNTDEWNAALATIRERGSGTIETPLIYTIYIYGYVSVPGSLVVGTSFGSVQHIEVTLIGSGKLSLNSSGSILRIGSNQTLIIDSETLYLQGRDDNNTSLLHIQSEGSLKLKEGIITNNNAGGQRGGGIQVNGDFTMKGGIIGNNSASWGGGVFVQNGNFTMKAGAISGNSTTQSAGGGVDVTRSTFIMEGGNISNNTASSGGGVSISRGNFIMTGGIISENVVNRDHRGTGGGVLVMGSIFTMKGGEIIYNISDGGSGLSLGGGVYVTNLNSSSGGVATTYSSTFTMKGGAINNNTAGGGGGVVVDFAGGGATATNNFIMTGGIISGNVATEYNGGGVMVFWDDGWDLSTFTKSGGGIIYGNTVVQSGRNGAAVSWRGTFRTGGQLILYRNTMLGEGDNICTNYPNINWEGHGNCNTNTPGFGLNLGVVTFDNRGHNTVIRGSGANSNIYQIWSGAVTATNCQKTSFNGGDLQAQNFNADCRSNPDFPGDLFSWCAVIRFADVLCPYPWRVPTKQDFIDLDIALAGNGNNRSSTPLFVTESYITHWYGAFGGLSLGGSWLPQGSWGYYWSKSELNPATGFYLHFSSNGTVKPQGWNYKTMGLSLRCVRDGTPIPVTGLSLNTTVTELFIGSTQQLTANVIPSIATNQNVSWSSSNINIATVNNSGLVTAISAGIATITATTQDGGHIATCIVTVENLDGITNFVVTNTTEWETALATIRAGGNNRTYLIEVIGDVAVSGITSALTGFGNNTDLIILLRGNGKLYLNNQGNIARLANGQKLIIDSESLTLQGYNNNNVSLVRVFGGGSFELRNGTITGNVSSAFEGGGVHSDGTFTMTGGIVSNNSVNNRGGGISSRGTFTMYGGKISGNSAGITTGSVTDGGGGVSVNAGTFSMTGGNINDNVANHGSAISVLGEGTFVLTGGEIRNNRIGTAHGSAVRVGDFFGGQNCIFTMTGGKISNNEGGGVHVSFSSFIMREGLISGNNLRGVNISSGTFTMEGGKISGNGVDFTNAGGNTSLISGGGVSVNSGTFIMDGGIISDNTANNDGGGVLINGTFIMERGEIRGNRTVVYRTGQATSGGGVRVSSRSTFTMRGGIISDNITNSSASSNTVGGGGGVYVFGGTFNMEGGRISNNVNSSDIGARPGRGGGVFVIDVRSTSGGNTYYFYGEFNMTGGIISSNTGYVGGGVYLRHNDVTFTKSGGGIIYGNNTGNTSNISNSGDGHAVFWRRAFSTNEPLWRNTMLGENDNISTENTMVGWGQ